MCEYHAQGVLRDLFRTIGISEPPKTSQDAQALGQGKVVLNDNFLWGLPNVARGTGYNGSQEAKRLVYDFLVEVKKSNGGKFPHHVESRAVLVEKHFEDLGNQLIANATSK